MIILSKHQISRKTDLVLGTNNPYAITIENDATLNLGGKNISIKNGGTIYLHGAIINALDVEFDMGSSVYMKIAALWSIDGNLKNHKKSTAIIINGTMTIDGSIVADSASAIRRRDMMLLPGRHVGEENVIRIILKSECSELKYFVITSDVLSTDMRYLLRVF